MKGVMPLFNNVRALGKSKSKTGCSFICRKHRSSEMWQVLLFCTCSETIGNRLMIHGKTSRPVAQVVRGPWLVTVSE